MATQAQEIIDTFHTLEECEEQAKKLCVGTEVPNSWETVYTLPDGSKLKREFMSLACENSSYIKAVK